MPHILLDTIYAELNKKNLLSNTYSQTFLPSAPLERHIEGLIKSKLSQNAHWEPIKAKISQIDALFEFYDEVKMRKHSSSYYLAGLAELRVGRFRKNLCDNLFKNIDYIKSILSVHPIAETDLLNLAKNLKGFGIPLVCEYFVYISVDRLKPDLHVKRILSRYYDGKDNSNNFTDEKTLVWGRNVRNIGKYNLTQTDVLLWGYCVESPEGAGICGNIPKCYLCPLSKVNGGNCKKG